jgi:hypothetical protein
MLDAQREQWQATYRANPDMYGTDPSEPGAYAAGLPDGGFDAAYSHMLFNMALTIAELETLSGEVHRALRPGGLHVYTVRHTGDAHYGAGTSHGDSTFENGGFIVHFFDRALVDRLATGFTLLDLTPFEEGGLPRRLWRITLRRKAAP